MMKKYGAIVICLLAVVVISVFAISKNQEKSTAAPVPSIKVLKIAEISPALTGETIIVEAQVGTLNKKDSQIYLLSTLKDPDGSAKIKGYMHSKESHYQDVYSLLDRVNHTNTTILIKGVVVNKTNTGLQLNILNAKEE